MGLGRGRFRLLGVSIGNRLRLCGRIWLGFRLFRIPYTGLYFWFGFFWVGFFWVGFFWGGFFWARLYVWAGFRGGN